MPSLRQMCNPLVNSYDTHRKRRSGTKNIVPIYNDTKIHISLQKAKYINNFNELQRKREPNIVKYFCSRMSAT